MNKCGDCQVCCEVLAVKGLKQKHIKCEYQGSKGCSIYKARPSACARFECVWITSNWHQNLRPDKSGIMLAAYENEIIAHRVKDKVDMDLFELIDGNKDIKGCDSRVIK